MSIDILPQNYSQYCTNTNTCGSKVIEKSIEAAYKKIIDEGKRQAYSDVANKIFKILDETLKIKKTKDVATLLGCSCSMISQLKNGAAFSEQMLKSILARHSSQIFSPILEFEKCNPRCITKPRNRKSRYPKNSWKLFSNSEKKEEKKIQNLLKNKDGSQKVGVYAMYDSAGRILYFGQTQAETGLYREITQQLDNKVNRSISLPQNGKLSQRGEWDLRMGDLTAYVTAIEVLVPDAIDNIETFVLRLIPNDDANTNLGNYDLIK
mgnify:CR=1 FL=1